MVKNEVQILRQKRKNESSQTVMYLLMPTNVLQLSDRAVTRTVLLRPFA
jgi:hypothetical protein